MEASSLSLMLYKFYGASEAHAVEAKNELARRGWPNFLQLAIGFIFLSLIFAERFIAHFDHDTWDEGPPDFVEIAFSISFSVFIITLIPGIIFAIISLLSKEWPHFSSVLLLLSAISLKLLPLPRKKPN